MTNVVRLREQRPRINVPRTLADLADTSRWVAWRPELRNGKKTKVPHSPVREGHAKSDDASTWGTRSQAELRAKRIGGAVGIQLGPLDSDHALGGLDLDGCYDAMGELAPWAADVIKRFDSYAEVSPSSKGIKIFFLYATMDLSALHVHMGDARHRKAWSRGKHLEIGLDLSNRYYAVTDRDISPGADLIGPTPLRLIPRDDLLWLLTEAGPAFAPQSDSAQGRDESGSGYGDRFLIEQARAGAKRGSAMAALMADEGIAGEWARRTSERELQRTWLHALSCAQEQRFDPESKFDDVTEDPGDSIDGFPLTEDGVALAFAQRYADKLRFCHSTGRWFEWTGVYWREEETQLAFDWARDTCRERAEKAPSRSAAAKAARAAFATAVEKFARADRAFAATAADWDRDPWLLGTPGGTVDLRTGLLRPSDPANMISKGTAVAPIPLNEFDPERHCPRWLAFLQHALNGDADAIRFLQQWAGYSLTGDTREEALLFVHGPSGSGKSTAVNTLAEVLGDYAVEIPAQTLMASNFDRHLTEIARLDGARYGYSSETEQGRSWNESRIKSLTGRDKMTANFMRQNHFTFTPKLKLVVMSNHRPRLSNLEGMDRRLIVLPFDHPPAQPDDTLKDGLKAEHPGILSWAICGCLHWQANKLVRPTVAIAATNAYFVEQDVFAQWLDEECECGDRLADTSERLWLNWSTFASRMGEEAGNRAKTFPERLKAKGFLPIQNAAGTRSRGFKGLRVIDRNGFDEKEDDDVI